MSNPGSPETSGDEVLDFTGERYQPEIGGNIELEHLHRYLQAAILARGKHVLDLACGEGYGSARMAEHAASVVGVDISHDAVAHANKTYVRPNLSFKQGDCASVPLPDHSVDLVVSFETIEHHDQHEAMMAEIKRVLKPDGVLLISSPDKLNYSDRPNYSNPYHVKELYEDEFKQLLARYFKQASYYGQRITYASTIIGEGPTSGLTTWAHTEAGVAASPGLPDPLYWIALASDAEIPELPVGMFEQPVDDSEVVKAWGQAVAERDAQIAEQASIHRGELNQLNQALRVRDHELNQERMRIAQLEAEHQRLLQSHSWRVTKPLRWAANQARLGRWGLQEFQRMVKDYGFAYTARKVAQVLSRDGLKAIAHRNRVMAEAAAGRARGPGADLYFVPPPQDGYQPKVSVIVPNYNHAPYLRERLDSIYSQTYQNYEVILLDDCSSDDSRAILQEYAQRYADRTTTVFNEQNSGGAFKQWQKGFGLATGELIWIAESDDYCDPGHLAELVRFFDNEAVMMAFCRSDFVSSDGSSKVWTSEDFLADTGVGNLDRAWVRSAHWLVNHGWGMKNLIPNVSSAVFRHPGQLPLMDDDTWKPMRLCGDWIFYLSLIRGGLVAYTPHTTNYYRQHGEGTSFNTQKKDIYYQEHEVVARVLLERYRIETNILDQQQRSLYQHWCANRGKDTEAEFKALYDLGRARAAAAPRRPNLLMAGYALSAGGGETFPVSLVNSLQQAGFGVTFLNCGRDRTEPGVRAMLTPGLPLLELDRIEDIGVVCRDMGIDVVHSHHAWVDITLAQNMPGDGYTRHIVTLHGMYEMMEKWELERLLPVMDRKVDYVVYTAEKNLPPFQKDFQSRKGFKRISNALAPQEISPIGRASLGIDEEDFVLCLVARAIPEKGWEEAIDALALAQADTPRRLHLILVGEGAELDRLQHRASETVHFMGFRANIRDYFAMADMGFLPSRFKGESYPLVLIDSLLAGKPVLASNVGEIAAMLDTDGQIAGALFDLVNGAIPIDEVARLIHRLSSDTDYYQSLLGRVEAAARKFDQSVMVQHYIDVYEQVVATTGEAA